MRRNASGTNRQPLNAGKNVTNAYKRMRMDANAYKRMRMDANAYKRMRMDAIQRQIQSYLKITIIILTLYRTRVKKKFSMMPGIVNNGGKMCVCDMI